MKYYIKNNEIILSSDSRVWGGEQTANDLFVSFDKEYSKTECFNDVNNWYEPVIPDTFNQDVNQLGAVSYDKEKDIVIYEVLENDIENELDLI
jgi:hypothetical protein